MESRDLFTAIQNSSLEEVKSFVENGADVNMPIIRKYSHSNRVTPLNFAVEKGNFEIVKYLIEKGATVSKGLDAMDESF